MNRLLLCVLLAVAPCALAQPGPPAAPLVDKVRVAAVHQQLASARSDQGAAAEAAGEWALAYALKKTPVLLLHCSKALWAAGQPLQAEVLLGHFLARAQRGSRERDKASRLLATITRSPEAREARRRLKGAVGPRTSRLALAPHLASAALKDGELAYAEERYLDALRTLAIAYALDSEPLLFLNLGHAAQGAALLEEAVLFLEATPPAELSAEVARTLQMDILALRRRLAGPANAPRVAPAAAPSMPAPALARPRGAPWIDATAGVSLAFHRLSFSGGADGCFAPGRLPTDPRYLSARCPGYGVFGLPGLRLAVAVYPLAALAEPLLHGLGIGAALDLWPRLPLCGSADPDARCAFELRLFVELRYRLPNFGPKDRLTAAAVVGYGLQRFDLQRSIDGVALDLGLPSFQAEQLSLGAEVSARVFSRGRLSLSSAVDGGLLYPFALRGISQDQAAPQAGYGPSHREPGFRVGVTALALYRGGLRVALRGSYQRLAASLSWSTPADVPPPKPTDNLGRDPAVPLLLASRMSFDQGDLLLQVSQSY